MPLFIPKDRTSLFRQFLAGLYDAVVITDPSGHILEVNPRAVEHFGYEIEEVLDKPISIYIPSLSPEIVERIRHGLEDDRHMMLDANARSKSGDKVACEITVSEIELSSPHDLVFTIRNVERRRKIINEFKAKANAFAIAQSALFVCDEKGAFLDANAAFLDMFDLKGGLDELRSRVFSDFFYDDPLPENFKKALAGEATLVGVVASGDDDEEEIEISLAPNRHGRKIYGVVGSVSKA